MHSPITMNAQFQSLCLFFHSELLFSHLHIILSIYLNMCNLRICFSCFFTHLANLYQLLFSCYLSRVYCLSIHYRAAAITNNGTKSERYRGAEHTHEAATLINSDLVFRLADFRLGQKDRLTRGAEKHMIILSRLDKYPSKN